ncbi:nucleophosmin isoform X2 [Eleutherodactylus coqui]|uniref:nucleophosmin isoform X2 n=1 Tax=Eleutherodactylus coqui TaxID=57060 RepID=UPI003461AAFD
MEDSMDMDNLAPLRPQNFLFGCELKADKKDYTFKVDDDESEHQLSLRTVSLGAAAKDELHIIEAEGMNYEGKQLKIILASLRPSVQPTVSLGGFEITPPVTLRLKSGSGPVYVSGQHLVALEDLGSSDEEDDEEEEENTEATKNAKRPATSASKVPQKKVKLDEEEDEDDDDEDDDDDDDEDDDDDDEDDDEDEDDEDEETTPVKKPVPVAKVKSAQKSSHNGKASEPSTPAKPLKTPEQKGKHEGKQPSPKTPKTPLTFEQIKEKMQATFDKGGSLPKVEARFTNYVKNCFRAENKKTIDDLWNWRKTMKDIK